MSSFEISSWGDPCDIDTDIYELYDMHCTIVHVNEEDIQHNHVNLNRLETK